MKRGSMASRKSLGDAAYRVLKEAIVSLDLDAGAFISEEEWARKLKMSRTPVREALNRLEHERLVRRVPNYGVFVSDLSIDEFLEICEVRALLEGNACRAAAKHVNDRDIAYFESEFRKLETGHPTAAMIRRANEVDHAFHRFIHDAAGNGQVVSIIAHLSDVITRMRFALTPSRYQESLEEHKRILAALKAHDGDAAAAAMHVHMENVSKSLHLVRSPQRSRLMRATARAQGSRSRGNLMPLTSR